MKWLLFLLMAGCATPPLTYEEQVQKCFKIMERHDVPKCHDLSKMDAWSDYEVGWELGFGTGYFTGCMDSQ